jgi:plastocyanin
MNSLDSRSLRIGNCFGQKFTVPGEVRYFLSPGGDLVPSADQRAEGGFVINVGPAAGKTEQHNVQVVRKGRALEPSSARLEIHAGDGVLWYTTDPTIGGFHVAGAGKGFRFNSASIEKDAIFTHVFGVPGKYEWRDAFGSGIGGSVLVENVSCASSEERNKWYELLKKPATFEVKGGKSSPESLKIVVGQTVFWSISDCKGLAISDSRLLRTPAKQK